MNQYKMLRGRDKPTINALYLGVEKSALTENRIANGMK